MASMIAKVPQVPGWDGQMVRSNEAWANADGKLERILQRQERFYLVR